jgi:hypothetical protein
MTNIYGKLNCEINLQGSGLNSSSIIGDGKILITDANLGPMPLLSPLLGNVYGVIRNLLPGLKSVEIQGAACDFKIQNRKALSNNIYLWGEAIDIRAQGYVDFDTNLNFDVQNEFKEITGAEVSDWQKAVVDTIAAFGKLISKARLGGTLKSPKWEFEYLNQFGSSNVQKQIANVLRGILKKE